MRVSGSTSSIRARNRIKAGGPLSPIFQALSCRNLRGKVPVELPEDLCFELGQGEVLREGMARSVHLDGYNMSARGSTLARCRRYGKKLAFTSEHQAL